MLSDLGVGADLAALCREASLLSLNRLSAQLFASAGAPGEEELLSLDTLVITAEDMSSALKVVRPSTLREVLVDVPKVQWSDIGGQDDTKQKLKEAVEWPLKVRLGCGVVWCGVVGAMRCCGVCLRCECAASRGVQADGYPTTTGHPPVRPAGLQQDAHGQGPRHRIRRQLHRRQGTYRAQLRTPPETRHTREPRQPLLVDVAAMTGSRAVQQVGGRVRASRARSVPQGPRRGSLHHLLRTPPCPLSLHQCD